MSQSCECMKWWGEGAAGRGDGESVRDLRGGTHGTWDEKGEGIKANSPVSCLKQLGEWHESLSGPHSGPLADCSTQVRPSGLLSTL